jgi:hypothetical protein
MFPVFQKMDQQREDLRLDLLFFTVVAEFEKLAINEVVTEPIPQIFNLNW